MKTLKDSLQVYKEIKALSETFTERELLILHNAFYAGAGVAIGVISQAPKDPTQTALLIDGVGIELKEHMLDLLSKVAEAIEQEQKKGEEEWTKTTASTTLQ